MKLESNKCLCKSEDNAVLYAERMKWATLSSHDFSARRDREIQHYRIVRCNHCGLVRSDPVLSAADIAALYRDCRLLDAKISGFASMTYASLLRRYLNGVHDRKNIHLLEVGCGNGAFLEELRALEIKEVVGIEPSQHAFSCATGEIQAHIVNDVFKRDCFKAETFDVICAFHVLDHLLRPDEFIKEAHRIVKTRGLILLVCHDVGSVIHRLFGEYSPIFDVEHVFLFDKTTLRNLMEENGFTVIDSGNLRNTYPLSYWLQYVPVLNKSTRFLPAFIRNRALTLPAGNLFLCAQKR